METNITNTQTQATPGKREPLNIIIGSKSPTAVQDLTNEANAAAATVDLHSVAQGGAIAQIGAAMYRATRKAREEANMTPADKHRAAVAVAVQEIDATVPPLEWLREIVYPGRLGFTNAARARYAIPVTEDGYLDTTQPERFAEAIAIMLCHGVFLDGPNRTPYFKDEADARRFAEDPTTQFMTLEAVGRIDAINAGLLPPTRPAVPVQAPESAKGASEPEGEKTAQEENND